MVAQGLRLRATIAAGVGLTPGRKTKIHMSKLAQPNKSVSNGKESACNAGDLGSVPGLGRSPGEGYGYPLQYSCLENSMERGAWQQVHGVTKSCAWLIN